MLTGWEIEKYIHSKFPLGEVILSAVIQLHALVVGTPGHRETFKFNQRLIHQAEGITGVLSMTDGKLTCLSAANILDVTESDESRGDF